MLRGLYTAATAMQMETERLNTIANNIANSQTAGFKKDEMISQSFPDLLVAKIDANADAVIRPLDIIGYVNHGVHIDRTVTDWSQGPLQQTDNATDMALLGDGFFVLNTADGYRYTRDGAFEVDGDGYLVTHDGYRVQGYVDDPMVLSDVVVGSDGFSVDASGNVRDKDGRYIATIAVVDFADKGALDKEGDNLYINYEPVNNPARPIETRIRQGYLEMSNVDVNREMMNMLEVYRHYESAQRVVSMLDHTLDKSVNEVGKI